MKSTVRTVYHYEVERDGDLISLRVCANGFLYNMVRIMVGTILEIAAGTKPEGCIPQILEKKDRSAAGATAPAWGLYLDQVFYDWHKPENESEG